MHNLPLQLSASAVRDFRQCPFRYALAYISPEDPRERPQEAMLAFGQVIHAALADFIRQGGWEVVDRDELPALLDTHWHDEVYPALGVAEDHYDHALQLLEHFFDGRRSGQLT